MALFQQVSTFYENFLADCEFFVFYAPSNCILKTAGADASRTERGISGNYISGPKYCKNEGILSAHANKNCINICFIEPEFNRILVMGGDANNAQIWTTDKSAGVWRKSTYLPHSGGSVYYPTTFIKDNKVS